jgi:2-haloacid dehalogenase
MPVVAFDSLGTLFDLDGMEERMPRVLHHALALTFVGEWAPLDEIAAALDPELAQRLPDLDPYDEALGALERVRDDGDEAWVLTNGGRDSTRKLLERGGLAGLVTQVRSAEEVERYKPHAAVYGLLPERATLVAAHAWDVVGARAAGLRAIWVDRAERGWPLPDRLAPDGTASSLVEAARLAGAS